jgi:hypothetical protein
MYRRKINAAVLMLAATSLCAPLAHATCTNASLKGVFGITSSGLNGSAQPAATVYQITADGVGGLTGSATRSSNGTITTFTLTGTYAIATNCTGTVTFKHQDGTTEHDSFVLDQGNKGVFLLQTDNNTIESSVAVAQGTVTCTDLGVKHTYATTATGLIIGTGQVAFVGQLKLNGLGALTGTETISLNGAITTGVSVTGTYQIKSNCTGTAAITPQGSPTRNVNLVLVNGGKELMVIETDASTVVVGTLQL